MEKSYQIALLCYAPVTLTISISQVKRNLGKLQQVHRTVFHQQHRQKILSMYIVYLVWLKYLCQKTEI